MRFRIVTDALEPETTMATILITFLIVITLCTGFAVVGAILGGRMEEKNLGAGNVETDMRSGMSASVLGGMLGILPFLVFVIALLITDATTDNGPSVQEEAAASTAAAAAREAEEH